MPIVSVTAGREILDARMVVGAWGAREGVDLLVPAEPTFAGIERTTSATTVGPLLLFGGFAELWAHAFAFAQTHPDCDLVLATTTESVVQALLTPSLPVHDVQAALTGMVPVHQADGGILERVQEARALSPLLRSPYEGVIFYLLEARAHTRGVFQPNQRVAKSSGKGSWEVDLLAADYRLVVEVDGRHHERPDQRGRDADKEDDLGRLGYEVLRFSAATVAERPVDVWHRIVRGLPETSPALEESS